jgi:hypothetical protein
LLPKATSGLKRATSAFVPIAANAVAEPSLADLDRDFKVFAADAEAHTAYRRSAD